MTNTLFDGLLSGRDSAAPFASEPLTGRTLSYGDLIAGSGRMANALIEMGVAPGDRVAAQVPKTIEALMLYLGVVRAGAAFLPLNTAYTPSEIEYFIADAEPSLFVCGPAGEAGYRENAAFAGLQIETLGEGGEGSLIAHTQSVAAEFDNVARADGDLAAILYTSGTTGRSKGAMLSHGNLLSNSQTLMQTWRFTSDDVLIHALPIFHTHGLFVATNVTLLAGGSLIFLPKFDADRIVEALPQATSMMGVPTFYTRLLDRDDFTRENTAHMRLFTSGSAPLLAETHRAFEARTGHRILERYGMTETNMNTSNPYDAERRAGTVGFPLDDVELRIVEPESGAPVPEGDVGMIEVKGANVFQGYWRMPEKTKAEFREDGFFITGDLGTLSPDGYVTIVGRGKDLIITGGFNVYPKEVEALLDEAEGVLESAVIGVPHPDFGEAVVAVVVPEAGAAPEEAALKAGIADRLAKFKQPKRVILTDALPRNALGKVQKNLLRETHAGLFQSA